MAIYRIATCLSLVTILLACTRHEPVPPPQTKINPNPQDRYEIVVEIENQSVPIENVFGSTVYTISNEQCIPIDYTRSLGGSTPYFRKKVGLRFSRNRALSFVSSLYRDYFSDGDYYGRGSCKWEIGPTSVKVHLQGLSYSAVIGGMKVLRHEHQDTFCLKPEVSKSVGRTLCDFNPPLLASKKFGRADFLRIRLVSRKI